MYNKLIFEIPDKDVNEKSDFQESFILYDRFKRKDLDLPNLSEIDIIRHYTNLSLKNYGVDQGFYPLGSCTMKYNPKINEYAASLDSFTKIHPLQPASTMQGTLKVYYETSKFLSSLTGMSEFSFCPFAGAHGEAVGLMIIKEYFIKLGDKKRTKIIIPDSAHGTNPASCGVVGFDTVEIKSNDQGTVDLQALKDALNDEVAAIMLTNPNTVGIFEKDFKEIAELVHANGSLLYYDGANLNAILGVARPADMGFDVMHINIHKTFSTPHGGGGPGSGPVGVVESLRELLPNPRVILENGKYDLLYSKDSIGLISSFYGNFLVVLKAYTYILALGRENIKAVGPLAVLNANYIKQSLKEDYLDVQEGFCMHEVVFDGLKDKSATTLDLAKRLMDYGYHPPTIYFPLLFHQALMIEPTETESKETLDGFIKVMKKIAEEARTNVSLLKEAPHITPVRRLDEVKAARTPILKYKDVL